MFTKEDFTVPQTLNHIGLITSRRNPLKFLTFSKKLGGPRPPRAPIARRHCYDHPLKFCGSKIQVPLSHATLIWP